MLWSLDPTTHTGGTFLGDPSTDPRSVAVSPDGKTIALGGADGMITVSNKETHKTITQFPVASVCPHKLADYSRSYHPCYINTMRFSPDGGTLQVASSAGNIGRWDTTTWSAHGDPLAAEVPCRSLVCDGRTLTTNAVASARTSA